MEEFVALRHCDLRSDLEKDIIAIKQEYWNYPYASQKEWLRNNLKKDDMHLLFYMNSNITAYLNLVNIAIGVENKIIPVIGVGNVCVKKSKTGNGFGHKIVERANEIIKEKNAIGILLCKESLERFYATLGWYKISCKDVSVADKNYDKIIMLLNSSITEIEKLTIDRNF